MAYDLARHDWRSFRLDRMTDPRRTGARFRPRTLPTSDAAEFVRAGMRALPTSYAVEALVHAPADVVRERVGRWARVDEAGEARCRLRMSSDSLDWPAMALGAIGVDFEILTPPELIIQLAEWGVRFSRAAGRAISA